MGNISKANLLDKDIRLLETKTSKYIKSVGNPKELYIWVNPNGIKSFCIRINEKGKTKHIKLKEFREGIYSVAEARKDALKLLKELESGKDIATIKGKNDKYLFKNLTTIFLNTQRKKCTKAYVDKIERTLEMYIMPKFANVDIAGIKASDLLEVLNAIYRPQNITASRLETIDRICNYLNKIFEIAIDDNYISKNPARKLRTNFPTKYKLYTANSYDERIVGLIDESQIKEWIKDFNSKTRMLDSNRRMIKLHILSANRPRNTITAKWAYIDFENKLWHIPANEMKMGVAHIVPLTEPMIQILKEQQLFTGDSEYIFEPKSFESAKNDYELENIICGRVNALRCAIQGVSSNAKKWSNKVTAHGWRKTFRTLATRNSAKLSLMGISNDVIEDCLAHKNGNKIERSYELQRATIEQKRALLEWYGNYLNAIEPLF